MASYSNTVERTDLKEYSVPLSEKVYLLLEEGILNTTYPSGMSLNECEIAEALNVSRSPVREALVKLESSGLVTRTRKGRVVSEIGPDDVRHNFEAWQMVESFSAGIACKRSSEAQIQEIVAALERLSQCNAQKDIARYREANYEFHACLVRPCNNPVLLSVYQNVVNHVKWASHYSLESPAEIDDSASSHSKILAAYIARDSALVEKLVRDHIEAAAQRASQKYHKKVSPPQP